VEKAPILLRLWQHFYYSPVALLQEFYALLNLPPRAEILEAYCLLATLEDPLQAAVVEGALPLETALWIGAYDSACQPCLPIRSLLSSWTKIFMYIIILILIDTYGIELLLAETSCKKAKMIHAIYSRSQS